MMAMTSTRRRLYTAMSLLAAAAVSGTLLGCSGFTTDEEALHLSSPTDRHPIAFRSGRAQLEVELPPHTAGLSPNQQADVMAFLHRFQAEGTGPMRIFAPGTNRASGTIREIRTMADDIGLTPNAIRLERYQAHGEGSDSLKLAYPRRVVMAPECGDWSEDLGRDHARLHYPNFGCATQRNLALNVANPRDLVQPQAEQPASSERRYVNWTKYVGVPATPGAPAAGADSGKQSAKGTGSNAGAASIKQ